MISIRASRAATRSDKIVELKREGTENNLSWLRRATNELSPAVSLILVGGRDAAHLRLRTAQSHARHDLTPSHWSHTLLTTDPELKSAWEIPLCPPTALGFPPSTNGVLEVPLKHYASRGDYPNMAVLSLPVDAGEVQRAVSHFQRDRAALDAVELLVAWLAFVWGVGRIGNPLLDGQGLPSAVFAEAVVAAAGLDLTPGLASRSSCPEAIWQSALWWEDYQTRDGRRGFEGRYCLGHRLD